MIVILAVCLCVNSETEEGGIWCTVGQRNALLPSKALAMNIKAVALRVPKLLCGPNQTHLSVLRLQAVPEPPVIEGWKQVDSTP